MEPPVAISSSSTSARFTLYELRLKAGDNLTYIKDGQERPITQQTFQIQVNTGGPAPLTLPRCSPPGERLRRRQWLYEPFHTMLDSVLDERLAADRPTALVSIHSFTRASGASKPSPFCLKSSSSGSRSGSADSGISSIRPSGR